MGLRQLVCSDCGFETSRGHGCLSLVSVVCCQVKVSAAGWSLVQKSPTECGVSECDRGTSYRRPRPTRAVEPWEKKKHRFGVVTISDRTATFHLRSHQLLSQSLRKYVNIACKRVPVFDEGKTAVMAVRRGTCSPAVRGTHPAKVCTSESSLEASLSRRCSVRELRVVNTGKQTVKVNKLFSSAKTPQLYRRGYHAGRTWSAPDGALTVCTIQLGHFAVWKHGSDLPAYSRWQRNKASSESYGDTCYFDSPANLPWTGYNSLILL